MGDAVVDYAATVREILDARQSRLRPDGMPWEEVTRQLAALPPESVPVLRDTAHHVLVSLPEADEGELDIVLSALVARGDPDAARLLTDAVEHRDTTQKESYVSMLDDLEEGDRGESALVNVVVRARTDRERPDLELTIRALAARQATAGLPYVADFVRHSDRAVRAAAIDFLFNLDESGYVAGPVFAEQLAHEHDPELLSELVTGLGEWCWTAALPALESLAQDPAQPSTVREAARRAVACADR